MAKKPGLEQMRWDIQDRLPTLPAATVRRLWQLMTKDEPVEVIDPEIVAAIKDRDSRTALTLTAIGVGATEVVEPVVLMYVSQHGYNVG
jgi:hypothetical protein